MREDHILCFSWQHQFQLSLSALCYNSITKDLIKFPANALLLWFTSPSTSHFIKSFLFHAAHHHLDPSQTFGYRGWIWHKNIIVLLLFAVCAHDQQEALHSNWLGILLCLFFLWENIIYHIVICYFPFKFFCISCPRTFNLTWKIWKDSSCQMSRDAVAHK